MKTLLIAGTDTNVGKTVVTSALVSYYLHHAPQSSVGLIKLIQTGTGDHQTYQNLFGAYPQVKILTPLTFIHPLAPPLAADREGREIDLAKVWHNLNTLQRNHDLVIAEAIGGLGTPVTHELTVADLAKEWRLPTILVVPVQLGAIGQAVTNVGYARLLQIRLVGIILNHRSADAESNSSDWAPVELIQSLTQLPVLGSCPYLEFPGEVDSLSRVAQSFNWELF